MKRMVPMARKEFFHLLRDPASLVIIFLMPVVMIIMYGYAMSFDLNRIDAGLINLSPGETTDSLCKRFSSNRYFVLHNLTLLPGDALQQGERQLREGRLKEIIVIPRNFSTQLARGRQAEIQFIIDGSDSNVANLVYQYNEIILQRFTLDYLKKENLFKISTKIYFNTELKSAFFFIPGLIAVLLIMVSALLTSLSIARERETGSIDLLFISPLKSAEIILGKTLPYVTVALMIECLILLFARFGFSIPIRGNLLVLLFFSLLFIVAGLSLGILLSTLAPNQKIAMFATLLITLLPSILLSGFIFPLDSLHPILQIISHLVPATYFLRIIRGVVLKGSSLENFVTEGIAMAIFSLLLLAMAMAQFTRLRRRAR